MRLSILLVIFGLLLAAGCLQKIGVNSDYVADYKTGLNYVTPGDNGYCELGTCICMLCKNGTTIFGTMKNLIGGYCYFEQNCTAEKLYSMGLHESPYGSLSVRHFMIGQGPTFGDFALANTYCSSSLDMSIQWLLGSNNSGYMLPSAERSMCFLSKEVIPVYILYSEGFQVDNDTQVTKIGEILGEDGSIYYLLSTGSVGPVIVVTEMNFNASDATYIANQVRAIDSACGNDRTSTPQQIHCLTAIGPKINDFEAVDAVMEALGDDASKLDLIAYGIDGKYVDSCDGAKIVLQAENFSAYSLYTYGKPTLIPYVLFDPGTNDSKNSCTWDENTVVNAYNSFFPLSIQSLIERGVLGIAPYSFNTTGGSGIVNPLNCSNCAVGKTTARLQAWYGGCQQYTMYEASATRQNPGGGSLLLFGNASGSTCYGGENYEYLFGMQFSGNDILAQKTAPLENSTPKYFSCDACVVGNASDPMPFGFTPNTADPGEYCTMYPEIDTWAGARNLDPTLVRAFIYAESRFDPCNAAWVTPDKCAGGLYYYMEDPAGTCPAFDEDLDMNDDGDPETGYCALGIMQSLEPPYNFWPGYVSDGYVTDQSSIYDSSHPSGADLELARSCNSVNFNPFNINDSLCVGTAKMQIYMENAKEVVAEYHSRGAYNTNYFNWGSTDYSKDNVFTAYVMAHMYFGSWNEEYGTPSAPLHTWCSSSNTNGECWINNFWYSWTHTQSYCDDYPDLAPYCEDGNLQPCYGYDDIIKYITDCEFGYTGETDTALEKMNTYFWFYNECNVTFCPDGKVLYDVLGETMPASGSVYYPGVITP